jgi:hypothetical protein
VGDIQPKKEEKLSQKTRKKYENWYRMQSYFKQRIWPKNVREKFDENKFLLFTFGKLCSNVTRIRIRFRTGTGSAFVLNCWIRIRIRLKLLDPDPYPDPHIINADPKKLVPGIPFTTSYICTNLDFSIE